jgi:hypothetical protein
MQMEDGAFESSRPSLRETDGCSHRTTVKDKLHGTNVALTEDELDLIHRLAKSENPDADYDP